MNDNLSLIKLSTKSWHFKLNQFVYGSKIINTNIQNLCPYFWLLLLAIIIVPFVSIIKILFIIPIRFIINKSNEKIEKKLYKWLDNLNSAQFCDVFVYISYSDSLYDYYLTIHKNGLLVNIPYKFYKLIVDNKYEFFNKWIYDHLKININNSEEKIEFNKHYIKFSEEREKAYNIIYNAKYEKKFLKEKKYEERKKREKKVIDIITKPFNWFFKIIKNAFTFNTTSKIIKTSKYIIGAIITIATALLFFLFVQYFVYLIILIANSNISLDILILSLAILFVIILLLLFIKFFRIFVIEYKYNNKHYLIIDLIIWITTHLIYKPTKILIYYPLYFIVVIFLWECICKSIIWNSLTSFWKGIISVSGIFGEYFSRSKGDYCPGIEWENEENC